MTKERVVKGERIHLCEVCGFGYKGKAIAKACQNWCSTHKSCNLQITKDAIYFPK